MFRTRAFALSNTGEGPLVRWSAGAYNHRTKGFVDLDPHDLEAGLFQLVPFVLDLPCGLCTRATTCP